MASAAIPFQADAQHLAVIHRHVADAVVEIVAGGKYVVIDGRNSLRHHVCGSQLAGGLPLPVREHLPQRGLGLLRDVERVGLAVLHRVKLVLDPLIGKLRIDLRTAGFYAVGADHQLVVTDDDRDVGHQMSKRPGTPGDHRQIFGLPVGFSKQNRAVRLQLRHLGKQLLLQPVDAGRFGDLVNMKFLQNSGPPLRRPRSEK